MNRRHFLTAGSTALAAAVLPIGAPAVEIQKKGDTSASVMVIKTPPLTSDNRFYVGNREPLLGSPFMKLPIGSIAPRGWLRQQLLFMVDGMTGQLADFSSYLHPTSGWMTFADTPNSWEELPYWLRGYGDLGYVLKDAKIIGEARRWLEASLDSQQADGYFGPPVNKEKNDLWPNMVMANALQSLYEWNGEKRVLSLLSAYFRYELSLPREKLLPPGWGKMRGGDNLASIYWLYNRSGEGWLLDLARVMHECTEDWVAGLPTPHGVNIAQGFREPAIYYQQTKEAKLLEATENDYATVRSEYGQVPGGGYAADENCRSGNTGPEHATETCAWVELMHSFEMLTNITGNSIWADRCEEVAFNSLPAALTRDLKGLHYLTAPNLAQCDPAPDHVFDNVGYLLPYSPHEIYRCCQHNVAFGWPYFAEHLWLATSGNGLAASLYAPCSVEAKVGHGVQVKIEEATGYPFDEAVELKLTTPKSVRFPLMLRVPGWCDKPSLAVNGKVQHFAAEPGGYIVVDRNWQDGDEVSLELPMKVAVKVWTKQNNAVSVYRGPLAYSLRIGERWEKIGGTDTWPELAIYPTTPWNVGLVLNSARPEESFRVVQRAKMAAQPFDVDAAPIVLHAQGRVLPQWKMVRKTAASPPPSPTNSTEPIRNVELIPMGCARLRTSVFPT